MKKFLAPACLLAAIVAGASPAAAVPSGPPTPFVENGALPASVCGFDISYTLTGKTKVITSPNGRTTTTTSPGQKITLVNDDSGASVSYVITGVRRETRVASTPLDIIETVVTGRNIVVNNQESDIPGLYVLVGEYNYAINTDFQEVRVFSGHGRVIDVCAALR